MNQVAKIEQVGRPSLIQTMATKAGMDPKQFEMTVRSTVMPKEHTNEQFAALMLVAHEYGLNPIVKEIYAFPAKGGGIVPIVSIDGWVNLVNSHPKCDGFTFEWEHGENGKLISCTCKMYRKDRAHPVEVTEYLAECRRNTDPWKMEHRMLRHKAMIQAARYAFGFSGIYDEDEGAKIAEMKDVTPAAKTLTPPPPPPAVASEPTSTIEGDEQAVAPDGDEEPEEIDLEEVDTGEVLLRGEQWANNCKNADDLDAWLDEFEPLYPLMGDDLDTLKGLFEAARVRIEGPNVTGA